jgi:hypothetical protein
MAHPMAPLPIRRPSGVHVEEESQHVTARLIIRRVKDFSPRAQAAGQGARWAIAPIAIFPEPGLS